jgi:hypothetical protein
VALAGLEPAAHFQETGCAVDEPGVCPHLLAEPMGGGRMPASHRSNPVTVSRSPRGALIRVLRRHVGATPGLTLTSALRQAQISSGKAYWLNRTGDRLMFRTAAELALAVGAPLGQFLEAVAWEMGLHPDPRPRAVLCGLPLSRSRGPGRPRKHSQNSRQARALRDPDPWVEVYLDPDERRPEDEPALEQGDVSGYQGRFPEDQQE